VSIRFNCPQCGHRLKADDTAAGGRARCSKCAAIVTIPSETSRRLSPDEGQGNTNEGTEISKGPRGGTGPEDSPAATTVAGASVSGASVSEVAPPFVSRRREPLSDDEIDMTPMIDVVFQLLIFFMVTAAFALQKSFPVPVPETTSTAPQAGTPDDQDAVTVRIDADDILWVDGTQAASRQDLIAKLRKLRAGAGGRRTLLVSADPQCRHESVVTALDAGSAAGMEDVELITDTEQ
jgi:biopolymer transport protein ExbD